MLKKDPIATALANFACQRSYVSWDGREVLFGDDWEQRVFQLWRRAEGRCEIIEKHESAREEMRCTRRAVHPHHKIKRSDKRHGRDDRLSNLLAICREHHKLAHPEKQTKWRPRKWLR